MLFLAFIAAVITNTVAGTAQLNTWPECNVPGYVYWAGAYSPQGSVGTRDVDWAAGGRQQLTSVCNSLPSCIAFSDPGDLKGALRPVQAWAWSTTAGDVARLCLGMYVKEPYAANMSSADAAAARAAALGPAGALLGPPSPEDSRAASTDGAHGMERARDRSGSNGTGAGDIAANGAVGHSRDGRTEDGRGCRNVSALIPGFQFYPNRFMDEPPLALEMTGVILDALAALNVAAFAEECYRCSWCYAFDTTGRIWGDVGKLSQYAEVLGQQGSDWKSVDVRQRGVCGGTYLKVPSGDAQGCSSYTDFAFYAGLYALSQTGSSMAGGSTLEGLLTVCSQSPALCAAAQWPEMVMLPKPSSTPLMYDAPPAPAGLCRGVYVRLPESFRFKSGKYSNKTFAEQYPSASATELSFSDVLLRFTAAPELRAAALPGCPPSDISCSNLVTATVSLTNTVALPQTGASGAAMHGSYGNLTFRVQRSDGSLVSYTWRLPAPRKSGKVTSEIKMFAVPVSGPGDLISISATNEPGYLSYGAVLVVETVVRSALSSAEASMNERPRAAASNPHQPSSGNSKRPKTGVIVGAIIGANIAVFVALAGVIFIIIRRRQRARGWPYDKPEREKLTLLFPGNAVLPTGADAGGDHHDCAAAPSPTSPPARSPFAAGGTFVVLARFNTARSSRVRDIPDALKVQGSDARVTDDAPYLESDGGGAAGPARTTPSIRRTITSASCCWRGAPVALTLPAGSSASSPSSPRHTFASAPTTRVRFSSATGIPALCEGAAALGPGGGGVGGDGGGVDVGVGGDGDGVVRVGAAPGHGQWEAPLPAIGSIESERGPAANVAPPLSSDVSVPYADGTFSAASVAEAGAGQVGPQVVVAVAASFCLAADPQAGLIDSASACCPSSTFDGAPAPTSGGNLTSMGALSSSRCHIAYGNVEGWARRLDSFAVSRFVDAPGSRCTDSSGAAGPAPTEVPAVSRCQSDVLQRPGSEARKSPGGSGRGTRDEGQRRQQHQPGRPPSLLATRTQPQEHHTQGVEIADDTKGRDGAVHVGNRGRRSSAERVDKPRGEDGPELAAAVSPNGKPGPPADERAESPSQGPPLQLAPQQPDASSKHSPFVPGQSARLLGSALVASSDPLSHTSGSQSRGGALERRGSGPLSLIAIEATHTTVVSSFHTATGGWSVLSCQQLGGEEALLPGSAAAPSPHEPEPQPEDLLQQLRGRLLGEVVQEGMAGGPEPSQGGLQQPRNQAWNDDQQLPQQLTPKGFVLATEDAAREVPAICAPADAREAHRVLVPEAAAAAAAAPHLNAPIDRGAPSKRLLLWQQPPGPLAPSPVWIPSDGLAWEPPGLQAVLAQLQGKAVADGGGGCGWPQTAAAEAMLQALSDTKETLPPSEPWQAQILPYNVSVPWCRLVKPVEPPLGAQGAAAAAAPGQPPHLPRPHQRSFERGSSGRMQAAAQPPQQQLLRTPLSPIPSDDNPDAQRACVLAHQVGENVKAHPVGAAAAAVAAAAAAAAVKTSAGAVQHPVLNHSPLPKPPSSSLGSEAHANSAPNTASSALAAPPATTLPNTSAPTNVRDALALESRVNETAAAGPSGAAVEAVAPSAAYCAMAAAAIMAKRVSTSPAWNSSANGYSSALSASACASVNSPTVTWRFSRNSLCGSCSTQGGGGGIAAAGPSMPATSSIGMSPVHTVGSARGGAGGSQGSGAQGGSGVASDEKDMLRYMYFNGVREEDGLQINPLVKVVVGEVPPLEDVDLLISPEDLQLTALIGKGASGEVYHAMWRGREVAVKKLLDSGLPHQQSQEMQTLLQEMAILARARHPNIVRCYGGCLSPPQILLVEELCVCSLYDFIYHPHGDRSLIKLLSLARDVAMGLAYLHPTILHRDLKPSNILIDISGRAKIADFGLARYKLQTRLSTHSIEAGTTPYLPPEVFDQRVKHVTDRSDVYSLGMVMWELIARQPPWYNMRDVAIAYNVHVNRARPALPPKDKCPPRLARLIQSCWAHRPRDRPSAAEVVKELTLCMAQLEMT